MKRIDKLGEMMIKGITLPFRVCIGVYNAIEKNTPETLDDMFPYELKRKEENNDKSEPRDESRTV